jgi:NitT/TauT family transport system permease protein
MTIDDIPPGDDELLLPDRQRSVRRRTLRALTPFLGIATLVAIWEVVVRARNIATYLVPPPSLVAETMVDEADILATNAVPTLIEAGLGFLVGNLVAVALAILFVHSDVASRALLPIAIFVRTIPIIAVAPLLVILFGYGLMPKVIVAALITFFPTLVNMMTGLRSVDRSLFELMDVLSASRREVLFKVRWYAALPYWFSALKVTVTMSVLGAIVAEWVGAREGLGYLVIQTTYDLRTPLLYATMVVTSLIALGGFLLIGVIEKLVIKWNPEERDVV